MHDSISVSFLNTKTSRGKEAGLWLPLGAGILLGPAGFSSQPRSWGSV